MNIFLTNKRRWAPHHLKGAALPLPLELKKLSGTSTPAQKFRKEQRSCSRSLEKKSAAQLAAHLLVYLFGLSN